MLNLHCSAKFTHSRAWFLSDLFSSRILPLIHDSLCSVQLSRNSDRKSTRKILLHKSQGANGPRYWGCTRILQRQQIPSLFFHHTSASFKFWGSPAQHLSNLWPSSLESRNQPSSTPLYLLQPWPLPGPVDCSTSWLHVALACYSQEENCQYPKNLLNVCKDDLGCRRRGDWVAARAENKLLYMTVHFWIAEEINAFACCSCITVPSHTEMKCCHVQQLALHCSSRESSCSDCSSEPQTTAENV